MSDALFIILNSIESFNCG